MLNHNVCRKGIAEGFCQDSYEGLANISVGYPEWGCYWHKSGTKELRKVVTLPECSKAGLGIVAIPTRSPKPDCILMSNELGGQ